LTLGLIILVYLEMLLHLEREEYEEMRSKVDYLQSIEETFEVTLYQEALTFLMSHPNLVESSEEVAN